jgi:CRP-like cAMP-binding protein
MRFNLRSPPTINCTVFNHFFSASSMALSINQEFRHKREPNQIKLKEPSGIPDELFHASAYELADRIRRRDRSPVDDANPFMARTGAPDFGASPSLSEAYSPAQERLRAHIDRTVALTDEEFAFVLAHFKVKHFRKHQFLIQEGQPVEYCYFVASGLLKLFYTHASGKQHIVSFAMEECWQSDCQAYFTRTRATLSLECLEDTVVFCLSLDDYHQLCAGLRKFERFFLQLALYGSMATQQRLLSLLTTQAKERYEHFLKQHPSLVQRVPKALLASYLGVTRETLSRLTP